MKDNMSARLYECTSCKEKYIINDIDDDIKYPKICLKCGNLVKHIGTVGTSI